jgi:hypothetical protein
MTALLPAVRPVFADFQYDLAGEDVYRSASTISRIYYSGTEQLSVKKDGPAVRFEAQAQYVRNAAQGRAGGTARFVADLLPSGTFEDRIDDDPDFLTILNQPFAVQLDSGTLADLRGMHGAVPFAATSPLGGGGVLRGFLRPGADGPVRGRPCIAVRFEASGPMTGSLPGQAGALRGSMRMDGTAYYAVDDALLLALQTTLMLDASVRRGKSAPAVPIKISYHRSIRAAGAQSTVSRLIKTLRSAPPATDGGMAAPASP